MSKHTLPATLPADWFASFGLPSSDGCYESFVVIHPSNSDYHPFVVHTASWVDDCEKPFWVYRNGTYCRTLEEAKSNFKVAIGA
jgi:hypothetical protein